MAKPRSDTRPPDLPKPRPTPGLTASPGGALREQQTVCPLHSVALSERGYCPAAEAYWVPKFACPTCRQPLWDNGYCPGCTPVTGVFPGDYYEQTWSPGRLFGHFVRLYHGPTPAPSEAEVSGYLAELHAITRKVGRAVVALRREMGDESGAVDEPDWITEGAPQF